MQIEKTEKSFLAVAEQATVKNSLEKQRQFYFSVTLSD